MKKVQAKADVTCKKSILNSTMHSPKRSQCNCYNIVSISKIGTVKNQLKQINRENNDYATGLFQFYGPYQA